MGRSLWTGDLSCHRHDLYVFFIVILICLKMTADGVSASTDEDEDQSLPLTAGTTDTGAQITQILNSFFATGYDKRVRPNYGGKPVEVQITMFIISISTVSEVKMDFTTDFYFRQTWQDPRLSFTPLPGIDNLYVGAEVAGRIWVPDTFFTNEKSAYFHEATTPNTFLRISSKGEVLRSIRLTVTASCPMLLQYFPMDSQLCSIEVESYGYSMADIRYTWQKGKKSIGLSPLLSLPQFRVVGHKQSEKEVYLSTGNYSRLICEIQFARSLGFYLIQIYIPASLIVVISWVSFWLHRNASPARVALGVTTVLTMTTLISSTNAQLPKISYIKSIDVYLGTCFVMVFAALLEYASVGYLGKRIAMRKSRCQQLAKLAEQHRQKCSAAAAAATVILQSSSQTAPNTPMIQRAQTPMICMQSSPGDPLGIRSSVTTNAQSSHTTTATLRTPLLRNRTNGRHHSSQQQQQPLEQQSVQVFFKTSGPSTVPTTNAYGSGMRTFPIRPATSSTALGGGSGGGGDRGEGGGHSFREPTAEESQAAFLPLFSKNLNKMFGVSSSDIDKYSRVVFPVCFICFNLMYWVIYLHISEHHIPDLILFTGE